jgi:hypothetical protein
MFRSNHCGRDDRKAATLSFSMSKDSPSNQLTRREFLNQTAAGAAAATVVGSALGSSIARAIEPSEKMIGIQVGSISFVDEGIEQVLDLLKQRGGVNTVFLTTFTYGRGLGGRQIPDQPFPDHGKQESDEKIFHGGNYATPHPKFYQDTALKQTRAPDHGDLDIVAAVLPAARKRDMKLLCSIEDVFRDVPKDELLRFNNHLLNYETEASLDALSTAGLSSDYVVRETKRALAGAQRKCKIYPGIDIGIPTAKNSRKASPEDTYAATFAALKAGAHGVILSRKYSEMRLANLDAAGRAVREVLK